MASRSVQDSMDIEEEIVGSPSSPPTPSVYLAASILSQMSRSTSNPINPTLYERARNISPLPDHFRFLDLPLDIRLIVYEAVHPHNSFDLGNVVEAQGSLFNVCKAITLELLDFVFRENHEVTYTVSWFRLPAMPVLRYPIIHRIVHLTMTIPDVKIDLEYVGEESELLLVIKVDHRFGYHTSVQRMARCLSRSTVFRRLSLILEWTNVSGGNVAGDEDWDDGFATYPSTHLASLLQEIPAIQNIEVRGSGDPEDPLPYDVDECFERFERKMPLCLQERDDHDGTDWEW